MRDMTLLDVERIVSVTALHYAVGIPLSQADKRQRFQESLVQSMADGGALVSSDGHAFYTWRHINGVYIPSTHIIGAASVDDPSLYFGSLTDEFVAEMNRRAESLGRRVDGQILPGTVAIYTDAKLGTHSIYKPELNVAFYSNLDS